MSDLTTMPTNEYIELWKAIYQGCPSWKGTHYQTLAGRKEKRDRKLFNGAKMVCRELTELMYSEEPDINMTKDIQDIFDRSGWDKNNFPFIEKVLAMGGGAYKLYTKDEKILIDFIPADRFIPVSWDDNGIYEADFLDIRVHDKKRYLRIEQHRKSTEEIGYVIKQEFYEINIKNTEGKVCLTKTTPLKAGYHIDEEEQEGVTIKTDRPLFSYIKLPGANNKDLESPLSISVYGNSEDTLQGLDIAFDSLQQELVLGRKRIIVPATAVRKVYDKDNEKLVRYFDPSDEVYQAFDADEKDSLKIMDNSMELRIDEIRMAVQTYLDILSIQVGFSAGYLTFDGQGGIKTATEVISENSKTHKTKVSYEGSIKTAIEDLIESIRSIEGIYKISVGKFSIEFQDNIQEDRDTKTAHWTGRLNDGTTTLEEVLMKIDNLTESEAIAKAEKIRTQNATGNINDITGFD
jgi:A118 family predicted phage portal protein